MKKRDKNPRKPVKPSHYFSGLFAQKKEGNKLRSPMSRMENFVTSSWQDDHLPLMLWAALLTETFPREQYLACFREILTCCHVWFIDGGAMFNQLSNKNSIEEGINYTLVLDMETIAHLPPNLFEQFISIPLKHPLGYAALRPILLLKSIPGLELWANELNTTPQISDWNTLACAIGSTLDHQSEKSTDIRWFKVMLPIMAGKMHFPKEMADHVEELYKYPNKGDLRSVRPSIRASEMTLRRSPTPIWVYDFWKECSLNTDCIDPTDLEKDIQGRPTNLTSVNVFKCRDDVMVRFFECRTSERVDARLDSAFGLVLYSLSIVTEIGAYSGHESLLGRLGLRSLVEVLITLKYLAFKDDPKIWSAWRVYGAGQAKLAFLKAQEITGDLPEFYELEQIRQIANEDIWQEFLDIDLGNWDRSNLRAIASACGAKDLYDQYYGLTSSFTHGHWGAVRDTNFITCHNPLHRLHRIPRIIHRHLSSMESDAVLLTNNAIDILDKLYPSETEITRLFLSEKR